MSQLSAGWCKECRAYGLLQPSGYCTQCQGLSDIGLLTLKAEVKRLKAENTDFEGRLVKFIRWAESKFNYNNNLLIGQKHNCAVELAIDKGNEFLAGRQAKIDKLEEAALSIYNDLVVGAIMYERAGIELFEAIGILTDRCPRCLSKSQTVVSNCTHPWHKK